MILEAGPAADQGGRLAGFAFHELPARPMKVFDLPVTGLGPDALARRLSELLEDLPRNAVVQLRLRGRLEAGSERTLRVEALRALHPPDMLVSVRLAPPEGLAEPREEGEWVWRHT